MNYQFTEEDVKNVEKLISIKNAGHYCDSGFLANVYNRVFMTNKQSTSCGSCMRARITELENALNQFKASEAKKAQELDNIKAEENKAAVEAGNEDMKARMARVRAARGKKK